MTVHRRQFLGTLVAIGTPTVAGCLGSSENSSDSPSETAGEALIDERIESDSTWDVELSDGKRLYVIIDATSGDELHYQRRAPDDTLYEAAAPGQSVEDSWLITQTGTHSVTVFTSSETAVELSVRPAQ